ncbi:SDR family NAD(P)-dependent oxidoreductase [Polycladomyces sp. WAk]|uniref:SDR family NAD(P)-dependent oxidoreductase n=1 Tax=Polycladomyces zharkentensis TaxID=2807616 RepID=A0ABS2WJT3_9BACL|nr:SDR family NAD(P)-dependent oxidoreductase [Polycladomyces sp. WAk]
MSEQRVAVVTGASKGLGKAITLRLAKGGITVVACARSEGLLQELARMHPDRILPFVCDVTNETDVQDAIAYTVETCGRLDILVNNAGLGRFAPVHELSVEDWDAMMNVNLKGAFLFSKHAIPHLIRQKGHIVNISSVAGTVTFAGGGAYCASKFGLMALNDVLTQELKPHEVKVTAICPGSIKTEFFGGSVKPYYLEPEHVAETVWHVVTAPPGVIYNQVIMRPQVPPTEQKK